MPTPTGSTAEILDSLGIEPNLEESIITINDLALLLLENEDLSQEEESRLQTDMRLRITNAESQCETEEDERLAREQAIDSDILNNRPDIGDESEYEIMNDEEQTAWIESDFSIIPDYFSLSRK